jgi:putative SOS response-associated peptidase YedK
MQVRFALPHHRYLLLAGIRTGDRCSIVTTEPNAVVGAYHTRMPLVLAPGESAIWLGPDFARLADRTQVGLVAQVEDAPPARGRQASPDAHVPGASRLF